PRRRRSTGPKEPIPIASTGPARSKKATAWPIVSAGIVVGIDSVARRSAGDVPIAHSHLEPPVSMPPYTPTLCYRYHSDVRRGSRPVRADDLQPLRAQRAPAAGAVIRTLAQLRL